MAAYHEYEQWKPSPMALPWPGGRNNQPYMWVRSVECVRAARERHRNEEFIKEHRMREMQQEA